MGTILVLDFIRIMCTLPSNYIARTFNRAQKVITFLGHNYIARNYNRTQESRSFLIN